MAACDIVRAREVSTEDLHIYTCDIARAREVSTEDLHIYTCDIVRAREVSTERRDIIHNSCQSFTNISIILYAKRSLKLYHFKINSF